eukprot:GCRY01000514.1.p1 GENE.GCRY01000514.1~~GCRY01000514.1.p1  ORF type:complete len:155 (+),score=7.44 GCRY01000514.1:169-633(+)
MAAPASGKDLSNMLDWKHEKFSCCDAGTGPCIYQTFCPCFAFGQSETKMDPERNMWLCCLGSWALMYCYLGPCVSLKLRLDAREKYLITAGTGAWDIIYALCCWPCSICQVTQEVNERESPVPPFEGMQIPKDQIVPPNGGAQMNSEVKQQETL